MSNLQETTLPFFDDYWIDVRQNIRRRWYRPEHLFDYIDPIVGGGYPTAVWSPEQGKYLLWTTYHYDPADDEICYVKLASSADGIHWAPEIVNPSADGTERVFPHTVYLGNPGVHGSAVFRDEDARDPAYRYLMAGMTRTGLHETAGVENSAVYLSHSPDGVHWTEDGDCMIHPHTSDTYNAIYKNPVTDEYNVILRAGFVDRRVCLTTSKDLRSWTRPRVVLHPDATFDDDASGVQFYGMPVRWMGGYFVGMLWRYYTSFSDGDYSRMRGYVDTELVYSYDGENWMRTTREPLVERPQAPEYGSSSIYLGNLYPSADGKRLFLTASSTRRMHGSVADNLRMHREDTRVNEAIQIYEIRPDGFCGLQADTTDGLIVTKSFALDGDVFYNLNAEFGLARFAFFHHDGTPYKGFDFSDSVPFTGDSLRYRPVFAHTDIAQLRGQRVRLGIRMDGAVLHSITGPLRPWIRFPQTSVCDPNHNF